MPAGMQPASRCEVILSSVIFTTPKSVNVLVASALLLARREIAYANLMTQIGVLAFHKNASNVYEKLICTPEGRRMTPAQLDGFFQRLLRDSGNRAEPGPLLDRLIPPPVRELHRQLLCGGALPSHMPSRDLRTCTATCHAGCALLVGLLLLCRTHMHPAGMLTGKGLSRPLEKHAVGSRCPGMHCGLVSISVGRAQSRRRCQNALSSVALAVVMA